MCWEVYEDADEQREVGGCEDDDCMHEVREWRGGLKKDELSMIFSHGSSMDRTNVTSTHILQRHNNLRHLELGGRVQFRSGFGEIRQ